MLAFSGPEHRDLSNAALQLAEKHYGGTVPAEIQNARGTFGELTAAVDLYDVEDTCELRVDPWTKLDRPSFWKYMLALHRNSSHFQKQAMDAYVTEHRYALSIAKTDLTKALNSEAIALHYLQDALAAGHMVTPRKGMRNAVAGALHDKTNELGAQVLITPHDPTWSVLLGKLESMQIALPDGRMNVKGEPVLTITPDDMAAMRAALQSESFPTTFRGDDYLNATPVQKIALVLLSARSIGDVLETANGKVLSEVMHACFTPRNALVGDPYSYRGSVGGFGRSVDKDVQHCKDGDQWLVQYDVSRNVYGGQRLDQSMYGFPAVQFTFLTGLSASSGRRRDMIEVAAVFAAEDPNGTVMKRDKDDSISETEKVPTILQGLSLHGSYMRGDGLDAYGGHMEYAFSISRGFSFGPRFTVRRYTGEDKRFYRFEPGARVAVGVEVVNLTMIYERGRRVRQDGSIAADTFIYGGFEVALSQAWVKRMFTRKGRETESPVSP